MQLYTAEIISRVFAIPLDTISAIMMKSLHRLQFSSGGKQILMLKIFFHVLHFWQYVPHIQGIKTNPSPETWGQSPLKHRVQLAISLTQKQDLNAHPFFSFSLCSPSQFQVHSYIKLTVSKPKICYDFAKRVSFPTFTPFKLFGRFSFYEGNHYMKC